MGVTLSVDELHPIAGFAGLRIECANEWVAGARTA
jgi:hypothetical protein